MSQSIPQIRKRNLLLELNSFIHQAVDDGHEQGAVTLFSAKIGVHKSLLSKLKGGGPSSRDISDSLARQIERNLSLDSGWMDIEHDEAPLTSAEESLLDLTLQASRALDAKGRTQLRRFLKVLAAGEVGQWPSA